MSWFSKIVDRIINLPKRLGKRPSDLQLLQELAREALKWVGVHEQKGKPGRGVDVFRKATDGVADGEPWCAAFVQYCVTTVALRYGIDIALYPSELCYNMWKNTPEKYRMKEPVPGSIIIWNYPGTIKGHTGIVLQKLKDPNMIRTIEGNTKNPTEGSDKNIRGVYPKFRCTKGSEDMVVLGYLNPFARQD